MVKQISRDELVKMMAKREKFKLVDVLPRDSFQNEHIKWAISMPLDEVEKLAPKLLKKKNEKIVVYCASFECQASTKAAEKLWGMGYINVLDYKGGLKDYKEGSLSFLEGAMHEKAASACSCC